MTVVRIALTLIDRALAATVEGERETYSKREVQDLLLDLRNNVKTADDFLTLQRYANRRRS